MGLYATSSAKFGKTWTNFFTGGDRPTTVAGVRPYVLAKLKAQLCSPQLDQAVAAKTATDAKQKTAANIAALRKKASDVLTALKFSAAEIGCP
jgi:hypothetical protein